MDPTTKINIPESSLERVVIVGGGFGGLQLARKLVKADFQVVLIDRNNYHQFQPLFYQVAMAGLEPSSIVFPFRKLFQGEKNMYIRMAEVTHVDPVARQLQTPLGHCNYDHLIVATGDIYEDAGARDIPRTLREATETLRSSAMLRAAMGDDRCQRLCRAIAGSCRRKDFTIV